MRGLRQQLDHEDKRAARTSGTLDLRALAESNREDLKLGETQQPETVAAGRQQNHSDRGSIFTRKP